MERCFVLDLLISPAYAQGAPQGDPFMSFLPLIVLVILFYFMLIRPQMKRSKEHRDMLGKLAKGDEVTTAAGLAGVVRDIGENYLNVEIAEGVTVKMQKSAITSVLPKGTLKTL